MIITRKYSGDKVITGNYIAEGVTGRSKTSILNDALVFDIITFDYQRGGTGSPGEKHDYRPQLLILGSNSNRYSGAKRMHDRITGINLHYLSQGQSNALINDTKNLFQYRLSSPKTVVDILMKKKYNPQNYRQYLVSKISKIYSLYSLGTLENVQDELGDEGSVEEYEEQQDEKIIARVNRNDKIKRVSDDLLESLGFEEPDIYK